MAATPKGTPQKAIVGNPIRQGAVELVSIGILSRIAAVAPRSGSQRHRRLSL
jgi:hypothetical protein